jgi:hypothetical protein
MLAVVQGGVWLVLLSHGGSGFVFGPMALAAAAVAHRLRAVAVLLLAIPVVWLTRSWLPALMGPELAPAAWQVWAVLTLPASGAIVALLVDAAQRRAGEETDRGSRL